MIIALALTGTVYHSSKSMFCVRRLNAITPGSNWPVGNSCEFTAKMLSIILLLSFTLLCLLSPSLRLSPGKVIWYYRENLSWESANRKFDYILTIIAPLYSGLFLCLFIASISAKFAFRSSLYPFSFNPSVKGYNKKSDSALPKSQYRLNFSIL